MLKLVYNRPVGRVLITPSHNSNEKFSCYRIEKIVKMDVTTPPDNIPCYKIKKQVKK